MGALKNLWSKIPLLWRLAGPGLLLALGAAALLQARGDGRLQGEAELAAGAFPAQPRQLHLFAAEEVRPWRSTRSVLPKKAPKPSSAP